MNLSNHLSLKEVIKSNTATRKGISNYPTQQHLQNLIILAKEVFEPIRVHFNTPIYVSSGYRSKALNKAVGGSKSSAHCKGQALDLDQDYRNTSVTNRQVFDYIKDNLQFTQLILEGGTEENPAWIHVSYDPSNLKKQVLRMKNGKYFNYE
jgi:hypothetical protein